jgi:hypothetical protein
MDYARGWLDLRRDDDVDLAPGFLSKPFHPYQRLQDV